VLLGNYVGLLQRAVKASDEVPVAREKRDSLVAFMERKAVSKFEKRQSVKVKGRKKNRGVRDPREDTKEEPSFPGAWQVPARRIRKKPEKKWELSS